MWPYLLDPAHGSIPTYYIFTSLAALAAIIWSLKRARHAGVAASQILDLATVIMICGFLGARLAHIFFETPGMTFSQWTYFFYFWEGGFVFYGGFLGALAASLIFVLRRKLSFLSLGDILAPTIGLGYAIGRLGCFFAGCCYGKACTYFWALKYPERLAGGIIEAPVGTALHPTPLYMALGEMLLVLLLLLLEKQTPMGQARAGKLFFIWLTGHGLGRLVAEQFRDDFRGQNVFNLSVSSWISLALIFVGIGFLLFAGKKKGRLNVSSFI